MMRAHNIINCYVLKLIVRLDYIYLYIYRDKFIYLRFNILHFTIWGKYERYGVSKVYEQAPNILSLISKILYAKYYILF